MEVFLDNVYGTLFFPRRTFMRLRDTAPIGQAAVISIALNCLDNGRQYGFSLGGLFLATMYGLIGWVILGVLLRGLAFSMGRDPLLNTVLVLIAFGALPWMFMAPVQALGGSLGALLGLVVLLWFVFWQVMAVSTALDLSWQRLVWVIPLTFAAGFIALVWTVGTLGAIQSLS